MATSGRDGNAGRSGPVRSVFEDFKPISEWKQEDESHILSIYLPGFNKEQIRVSTEGRNTIRVRGERLVAGNKWSRFLDDFQVPQDGDMNTVRAKFQGGILNIIVPKKISKPKQDTLPPKSVNAQKQPTSQKNQDKVTPPITTKEEKSQEPQKQVEKEKDIVTPLGTVPRITERKEKSAVPERVDGVIKKIADEKNKVSEGIKGLLPEKITTAKHEPGAASIEKTKEPKGKEIKTTEKYKNAVKELTELNEDRQLLMNMGVGVLVVMALSAYVAYKFASGKNDK